MFDNETMKLLYKRMCEVRDLEYALKEQHAAGKIRGPVHLCVGQEATGVGAGICLRDDVDTPILWVRDWTSSPW